MKLQRAHLRDIAVRLSNIPTLQSSKLTVLHQQIRTIAFYQNNMKSFPQTSKSIIPTLNSQSNPVLLSKTIPRKYIITKRGYSTEREDKNSDILSTEFVDTKELIEDLFIDLKAIYKNQNTTVKSKAKRLKLKLNEIIYVLPNNEFKNEDLPFVNEVINFIDQGADPHDSWEYDELLTILRSTLGAMTSEDVKYLDFFPRFYNSLRHSNLYSTDKFVRLQLFEIFVNYVLFSNKRSNLLKVIDAYIEEERTTNGEDVKEEVVSVILEAFKNDTKPDTTTILRLAELSSLSTVETTNAILTNFFIAGDEEISENFEDNKVYEKMQPLIDSIDSKIAVPLTEYINLLYFSDKNNFNETCFYILKKMCKMTNDFQNIELMDKIKNEEFFAVINASLQFNNYNSSATRLVENFKLKNKEENFTRSEFLALFKYDIYSMNKDAHDGSLAMDLLNDLNEKIERLNESNEEKQSHLHPDDRDGSKFIELFDDVETYNEIIEACCFSNKNIDFIESFTQVYSETFELERTARSFGILINHHLNDNNLKESLDLFNRSIKEYVHWGDDSGGIYMPILFRLLNTYCKESDDDLQLKVDCFKQIKSYGFKLDRTSMTTMVECFLKGDFVGDAMEMFRREVPDVEKPEDRFYVDKYPKVFELYYNYVLTSKKEIEMNWSLYGFMQKMFHIPYETYFPVMKFFSDNGRPNAALKIFATMRKLSKQENLPPPTEEMYIYLFRNFGQQLYEEGVFKLHLALKMDLSVDLNINLLNSIMEGYCCLEDPFKVRDMFDLATSLPKDRGLNSDSCKFMLRSLRFASLNHVNEFYNNLSQFDILPSPEIFSEYLIANCYYEQYTTALNLLIDAQQAGDIEINGEVLKSIYNWTLLPAARDEIDKYATDNFPQLWQELKDQNQLQENEEYPEITSASKGLVSN